MHLCYFDESVDLKFFVLAAVLMREEDWRENLDIALRLRRRARTRAGIPVTAELKATHIRKGTGPLSTVKMTTDERGKLLHRLLRWQNDKIRTKVFAVAIDKAKLDPDSDPREWAWKLAVERVETFCKYEKSNAVLFPDSGHGYFIRRLVRKMRRHDLIQGRYGGLLQRKCQRIVEDPNDRLSHESLFIQVADWDAFAALRSQYIAPTVESFAGAWDELGGSHVKVEKLTKLPHVPGMKLYPK